MRGGFDMILTLWLDVTTDGQQLEFVQRLEVGKFMGVFMGVVAVLSFQPQTSVHAIAARGE